MKPGPAFIPKWSWVEKLSPQEERWVDLGAMVWKEHTEWTAGGWVRPRGGCDERVQ